jgi:hypothetical protein
MLILYSVTLPKKFMISSSFLVKFLGSLRYRIMSPANRDSLTSFFPIWIPFISCFHLIALARNSKTILNKSGESGHPCLVSEGSGFSSSPFGMMLALSLLYIAFITLRNIPSIPSFFRAFIMKGCWILSKAFSASRGSCSFCPCFCLYPVLCLWIYVCWTILASLEWNQLSHVVWSFLMCCWILFASILLRIFASIFIKDIGL